MIDILKDNIKKAIKDIYDVDLSAVLIEHPDNITFGDFSTNSALVLAKIVKQSPMEIAKKIVYKLEKLNQDFTVGEKRYPIFKSIEILQPGFINFKLSDEWLKNVLFLINDSKSGYGSSEFFNKNNIIVEYTDPNPLKVFHIGHLMTNTIGESISRIFQFSGGNVKRANYQGDVGMHVAKTTWGMLKKLKEENKEIKDLESLPLEERIVYMGKAYVLANTEFSENESVKNDIQHLNNVLYKVSQEMLKEEYGTHSSVNYGEVPEDNFGYDYTAVKEIYFNGRKWSLDYFETLYKRLGSKFDFYYFESQMAEEAFNIVNEYLKKDVFALSEGAIIFNGDKFGLHTRVFINSLGVPLYEAKDLALALAKYRDFSYDKSIIVTANEQSEYFKVVMKALEQINPDIALKTTHIGHGMMRFKAGKMSSRTGNVVSGDVLLNSSKEKVLEKMASSEIQKVMDDKEDTADKIAVSAIKYSILKNGIGNNIVYDEEESLNLTGNTGPYLVYTYARINSVMEKSGTTVENAVNGYVIDGIALNEKELDILKHIYKFPEIVLMSAQRLAPNLIAGFIYELAQKFNAFYSEVPILSAHNDSEKNFRIHLSHSIGQIIRTGLDLLGIAVVDKM